MAYHEVTYLSFCHWCWIAHQIVPQKRVLVCPASGRICILLVFQQKSGIGVDGNVHVYALYRTLAGTGQRGRR